ncbi:NUDIX domain-containing protein [Piscinibacter sp.]|uniref:NUDIX domain-containing protein n=1 Tax=Piscinibacter sp. TaxID=1903157 RepID=UPI0039E41AC5
MSDDAPWLAELRRRAAQPPLQAREPLCWGAAEIGSIEAALGERMQGDGLPLRREAGAWQIGSRDDETLAELAAWLREHGLAGRWRDELLPVIDAEGRVHGAIERAAMRPLGLITQAVHLVGRHPDGRFWVQQRAHDKATDPGLWDTLVGGLMAAGETVQTTLERETWEEAGLRLRELEGVQPLGHLQVRRPVAEGYMVERAVLFQAVVPRRLAPENRDGEVAGFACVDAAALREGLAAGRYTLEAALIHAHALALDAAPR